jgi:hypothetical protein
VQHSAHTCLLACLGPASDDALSRAQTHGQQRMQTRQGGQARRPRRPPCSRSPAPARACPAVRRHSRHSRQSRACPENARGRRGPGSSISSSPKLCSSGTPVAAQRDTPLNWGYIAAGGRPRGGPGAPALRCRPACRKISCSSSSGSRFSGEGGRRAAAPAARQPASLRGMQMGAGRAAAADRERGRRCRARRLLAVGGRGCAGRSRVPLLCQGQQGILWHHRGALSHSDPAREGYTSGHQPFSVTHILAAPMVRSGGRRRKRFTLQPACDADNVIQDTQGNAGRTIEGQERQPRDRVRPAGVHLRSCKHWSRVGRLATPGSQQVLCAMLPATQPLRAAA